MTEENVDEVPLFLEKSVSNLNEIQSHLTDDGFKSLVGEIDIDKTDFTPLGMMTTLENKHGEEFSVIVSDEKLDLNSIANRYRVFVGGGRDIRLNDRLKQVGSFVNGFQGLEVSEMRH